MPLRKVHELAFLGFGLPGRLLIDPIRIWKGGFRVRIGSQSGQNRVRLEGFGGGRGQRGSAAAAPPESHDPSC